MKDTKKETPEKKQLKRPVVKPVVNLIGFNKGGNDVKLASVRYKGIAYGIKDIAQILDKVNPDAGKNDETA